MSEIGTGGSRPGAGVAALPVAGDYHVVLSAFRPVADLVSGRMVANEIVALNVSLAHGVARPNIPEAAVSLDAALKAAVARSPGDLMMVLAPDQFLVLPDDPQCAGIRALASSGTRLTVLAGGAAVNAQGLAAGIAAWRELGCEIGLDGFGYAAVPALWPLAHRFDMVRIDARLCAMHAAGALRDDTLCRLLEFVASFGLRRLVVDGLCSAQQAALARDGGATHGQGPYVGEARFTAPAGTRSGFVIPWR